MKNAALLFAFVAFWCALFLVLNYSIDAEEKSKCYRLHMYSGQYPDFYITRGEAAMCARLDFIIDAPIR